MPFKVGDVAGLDDAEADKLIKEGVCKAHTSGKNKMVDAPEAKTKADDATGDDPPATEGKSVSRRKEATKN